MTRPLCFVLMPFGTKTDSSGRAIDFDRLYTGVIAPSVEAAGLEPLRADQEGLGGIIHKAMFERLLLCPYAVADLTTANANVFYELGVRHAARPHSTVLMHCASERLPFDLGPVRSLPYKVGVKGRPSDADATRAALGKQLAAVVGRGEADSPIYQLLDWVRQPDGIDHAKTDLFREQVAYSRTAKRRLAEARDDGLEAVRAEEAALGDLSRIEAGILVDLLLSYRAVKAWVDMIGLAERLPAPLRGTVLVREQYALALNRAGRGALAERELRDLIEERGASSETYGLLGRVYKDRWEGAHAAGRDAEAAGLLDKAIDTYLKGFEADFRDAYPGINAVTLMDIRNPPDERRHELLPVVRYAVTRKMAAHEPDYWDHATLLELAVLAGDEAAARGHLANALASMREKWEPETTARNLRLIAEVRDARRGAEDWMTAVMAELDGAAQ